MAVRVGTLRLAPRLAGLVYLLLRRAEGLVGATQPHRPRLVGAVGHRVGVLMRFAGLLAGVPRSLAYLAFRRWLPVRAARRRAASPSSSWALATCSW
jgi:hypothetical protein